MGLQFILGKSGSGKSFTLYNQVIKESMEHTENNYIVLVPEQVTMQTKKELAGLHPNGVLLNIDVLNFPRFAYRVFDETGGMTMPVLDDVGKSLVLRKVALENEKYLPVLGPNMRKTGYIQEVKSVISELEQYGIKPEDLKERAEAFGNRPALQYKLRDICTLYQAFCDYLDGKYIITEELLETLCKVADRSELISRSTFVLDGFTGFTPVQYALLKELLRYGKKVMITVTIDPALYPVRNIKEQELFCLSKKTIRKLEELAGQTGVEIEPPVMLEKEHLPAFHGNQPLEFLEENLFRYKSNSYEKRQQTISVHQLANPYGEVVFAAEKIQQMVQKKGYHYKDFAIISGSVETYEMYLESVFNNYNIPYFKDNKRCILKNPMMECISSVMEMLIRDFDYKSVMRYLRSGMSELKREEIDKLENYIIALGIRGYSQWSKIFTRKYRGFEKEELPLINECRERFLEEISVLREEIGGKSTVKEKTMALYHFLMTRKMQQRISDYEEYFKAEGELALAKEYAQIYKLLMDMLQVYVDLLGEEKVTLKDYWEILEAGFAQTSIGNIPPTTDQVMVGDMERSRLNGSKVLIFIGVNDGIVPNTTGKGGLLSDLERETMAKGNLELSSGPREQFYTQKFYLYLNLTKARERLFVTYAGTDAQGKVLRPSYLISTLERLYPRLKVKEEPVLRGTDSFYSPKDVVTYLLQELEEEEPSKQWKEVFSWFYGREEGRKMLQPYLELKFNRKKENKISQAVAEALYGKELRGSVTRLEQFANCACQHFLNYGLNLRERIEFAFAATDMGTIFHETLERFAVCLSEKALLWQELTEQQRNDILEECLQASLAEYAQSNLYASARNRYMEERMRRILRRAVWGLGKQLEVGKFVPSRFEVSFAEAADLQSVNVLLENQKKMHLSGRIDRVDTYETDDKVYVKVIDYKSGNTKFDMVAVYYGLQLQLAVYLNVAKEIMGKKYPDKEIQPAGIFYYKIADPVVEADGSETDEELEKKILSDLQMSGIVRKEEEIIELFDRTEEAKSRVIPVSRTKNGISATSKVHEQYEFDLLSKFVQNKITQLGQDIMNGEMEASPFAFGNGSSCTYCKYQGLCGFDGRKDTYKKCQNMKSEEVLKKMREELYGSEMDQ